MIFGLHARYTTTSRIGLTAKRSTNWIMSTWPIFPVFSTKLYDFYPRFFNGWIIFSCFKVFWVVKSNSKSKVLSLPSCFIRLNPAMGFNFLSVSNTFPGSCVFRMIRWMTTCRITMAPISCLAMPLTNIWHTKIIMVPIIIPFVADDTVDVSRSFRIWHLSPDWVGYGFEVFVEDVFAASSTLEDFWLYEIDHERVSFFAIRNLNRISKINLKMHFCHPIFNSNWCKFP